MEWLIERQSQERIRPGRNGRRGRTRGPSSSAALRDLKKRSIKSQDARV